VAAIETATAKLQDLHLTQGVTVGRRPAVERDHAVGNALQLQVGGLARTIVEEQGRTVAASEELLQGQDLLPVAQRALGEQPQLRQRIEHHALRTIPLDGIEQSARRDRKSTRLNSS